MSFKVEVRIDPKAALLVGCDLSGDVVVEVDLKRLLPEEREIMASRLKQSGNFNVSLTQMSFRVGLHNEKTPCSQIAISSLGDDPVLTVKEILQAYIKEERECHAIYATHLKEYTQLRKQELKEWLATPIDDAFFNAEDKVGVQVDDSEVLMTVPWSERFEVNNLDRRLKIFTLDDAESIDEKHQKINAFRDAHYVPDAIAAYKKTELEKEEDAKNEAKSWADHQRFFDTWVQDLCSGEQKERFVNGFLPEQEVLDLARGLYLDIFSDLERFKQLKANDCPCECGDWECSLNFEVCDLQELSAKEFAKLQEVKLLADAVTGDLPKGKYFRVEVKPLVHVGKREDCGSKVTRRSIKIEFMIARWQFSREYLL